jgi:transcriptional regulator with XRE-family HTH domain
MLTLKSYRERKGFSQEALAKMLGVTKSAVSRWESGERSPRISEINTLARKMGIEPAELLGLKPSKNGG